MVNGKRLVLINAWDNVSFIGNGGHYDHTVDGMMVAGIPPNTSFRNTSYLHNPCFHPSMGNPKQWLAMPDYMFDQTERSFEIRGIPDDVKNSFHIVDTIHVRNSFIHVAHGSVTLFNGDAIVNAANEKCLTGGGIDGAITALGGPELAAKRQALPESVPDVRCPTGSAVLTTGDFGALPSVIVHAVGPDFRDAPPDQKDNMYRLLRLANARAVVVAGSAAKSVAFSLLSAGIFKGDEPLHKVLLEGLLGIATASMMLPEGKAPEHVVMCAYTVDSEDTSKDEPTQLREAFRSFKKLNNWQDLIDDGDRADVQRTIDNS